MKNHVIHCGIPGVGKVPHDFHMCHFYPSRQDLIEALIPYFAAGVNNNERCIWIASSPAPKAEIKTEIANHPELSGADGSGQLTIADAVDWYENPVAIDVDKMVQRWIDEEELALKNGYAGLRIAGNAGFMPRENWALLMEYEKKFHERIRGRRIMTCCSYSRHDCRPIDILEVARSHDAALDRADQNWQVFVQHSTGS